MHNEAFLVELVPALDSKPDPAEVLLIIPATR